MDNPVTLPELQNALDDLIADTFGPPLAEDDVTIMRFSERANCTHKTAVKRIAELVAAERLEYIGKRRAPSGKMLDAWRVKPKPALVFTTEAG